MALYTAGIQCYYNHVAIEDLFYDNYRAQE